jgi:hypothetical protein
VIPSLSFTKRMSIPMCENCQQLKTDLRLTREALALAEAALAESQETTSAAI